MSSDPKINENRYFINKDVLDRLAGRYMLAVDGTVKRNYEIFNHCDNLFYPR